MKCCEAGVSYCGRASRSIAPVCRKPLIPGGCVRDGPISRRWELASPGIVAIWLISTAWGPFPTLAQRETGIVFQEIWYLANGHEAVLESSTLNFGVVVAGNST